MDFSAIADRAVAIIGSADPAQFQMAYDAMITETESVALTENYETERAVLSRLGVTTGDAILTKIESAVPARVQRLIQSETGINLADPQTIGLVASLVSASVLTQADADALLASNTVTQPKWPGLKAGYVYDALTKRAAGDL